MEKKKKANIKLRKGETMKRKVQGSGYDNEVEVTGEEAYRALDALRLRNRGERGGRDAKEMDRLQSQGDKKIRKNLEDPLRK